MVKMVKAVKAPGNNSPPRGRARPWPTVYSGTSAARLPAVLSGRSASIPVNRRFRQRSSQILKQDLPSLGPAAIGHGGKDGIRGLSHRSVSSKCSLRSPLPRAHLLSPCTRARLGKVDFLDRGWLSFFLCFFFKKNCIFFPLRARKKSLLKHDPPR